MAIVSIENIKLTGLAACVPQFEYNNNDYDLIPPAERTLLINTIGVEKRRMAGARITTSDMCQKAAGKLFEEMQISPAEIDIVIFVSQSRDYILPCTAIVLQNKMGIPVTSLAFDVPLGCSGYVYGMYIMGSILSKGQIKKGLLLVGDISTMSTSYLDPSTFPLFGDSGTATVFEYDKTAEPVWFNLQSDGGGWEAISIPEGGTRNFPKEDSFRLKEVMPGIKRNRFQLHLNGIEVFNFSLREVVPNIKTLLSHISKNTADFDYYLFHQANKLMNESIRKKLKLGPEKVPYTLNKYGNTSSASIPLTMVSEIRKELKENELNLILSGFGVGLSWGSAAVKTNKIICPELMEYPNLGDKTPVFKISDNDTVPKSEIK